MMEKSLKYLTDIKIAIEFIQEFMLEIESFEDYCNDHKTQSAVERQLVIIWAIIKRHLEPLEEEIQTIIKQPQ